MEQLKKDKIIVASWSMLDTSSPGAFVSGISGSIAIAALDTADNCKVDLLIGTNSTRCTCRSAWCAGARSQRARDNDTRCGLPPARQELAT